MVSTIKNCDGWDSFSYSIYLEKSSCYYKIKTVSIRRGIVAEIRDLADIRKAGH